MTFETHGFDEIAAKMLAQNPKSMIRALVEEAELIKADSMDNTPVDRGWLKGSHVRHPPKTSGDTTEVKITVGDNAAVFYAVYVHENLQANHPIGEAKFLENALNRGMVGLLDRIVARARGFGGDAAL